MKTIRFGGPLVVACPTCRAQRGQRCVVLSKRGPVAVRSEPHAARVRLAPKTHVIVNEGDLVIVALSGREALAHLKTIGDETAIVRVWRPGAQAFAAPRLVAHHSILRPAPETAAEKLAKEQLEAEALRSALRGRREALGSSQGPRGLRTSALGEGQQARARRAACGPLPLREPRDREPGRAPRVVLVE